MYIANKFEHDVESFYKANKILKPSDIKIERIASLHNFSLLLVPAPSFRYTKDHQCTIIVDSRNNYFKQKASFFHELCHAVYHSGNPCNVSKSFRLYQEYQANNYSLVASMPYFMLKEYDLSSEAILEDISYNFEIEYTLVLKRLKQIETRSISFV